VELAAPAGTTVLLLGETGTGKELFARAIHNLSRAAIAPSSKSIALPFPAVFSNPNFSGTSAAPLPAPSTRKSAASSSPIAARSPRRSWRPSPRAPAQASSRPPGAGFERLGGNRTQRVDVRVVTATHQDLAKLVSERAFRSDLFYRLNVFPIQIPALRERAEDLPLLVRYFVQRFSRQLNKTSSTFPPTPWTLLPNTPGPAMCANSRTSSSAPFCFLPVGASCSPHGIEIRLRPRRSFRRRSSSSSVSFTSLTSSNPSISTLEEAERQHILRALKQTQWRIAGPKGAAMLLGIKRTTLQARMRKLGIRRPFSSAILRLTKFRTRQEKR